ncbi:MAG: hypothetical protein IJ272_11015 [Clostridia bacterium]|nr:hypothetical protein [Clostridia bacterium]
MEFNIGEIIVDEEIDMGDLELDAVKVYSDDGPPQNEVYVGTDEPTEESVEVWIDPSGEADKIPRKVSELENDLGFTTAPKVDKSTYTATGINIANNTIHRFTNTMTNLSLALPSEINDLFQCEVVFKSGTTATSLTYDNSIKWSGDDMKDNKFVPVANKTYNIIFCYDGFNLNGVVRGV